MFYSKSTMVSREIKNKFRVSPWIIGILVSASMAASLISILRSFENPDLKTQILPERTFYDDPKVGYAIGQRVKNWDAKRRDWLSHNPTIKGDKILVITGSQPSKCENDMGDHLLLRMFKNKVDYCRIHGCDIYYNNVFLNPKMGGYWAKYPIIRAAMIAHPEAEWIWWVDADAIFTDMDFKIPIERYNDHNLVVNGWHDMIYKQRSWVGLNAGVFLIRNCQWSMRLLEVWASMGPQSPNYKQWGQAQKSLLKDKTFSVSDDQSSLIYLLIKENKKWAKKIYLETEYALHGYWLYIVDTYDDVGKSYMEMERGEEKLRRRHGERESELYGEMVKVGLTEKLGFKRRPFITHFTGCSPCSGRHNPAYTWEKCFKGMQNALNFAGNQVLRQYGFVHSNLTDSALVSMLNFDFPGSLD